MHLLILGNSERVTSVMQSVVSPIMTTLIVIAGLSSVLFIVLGGIQYISSNGRPDKLDRAKKIIRNALIGLVIVLGAASLTAVLNHAYNGNSISPTQSAVPALHAIKQNNTSFSLVQIIIKAIVGVLQSIIESVAAPFINSLQFFTTATPLMASNTSVFNLWLAILAIADALFVLVVAALGFHLMSATSFGISEIEFKHLLPQLGLAFLLMNSSIFAIDVIIGISNGMIDAIRAGFGDLSVWGSLTSITQQAGSSSFAALLIMIVFVILSVILLVYYVGRLVTLYLGAVLSPLILMLWLLPSFKDFASTAIKSYLTTIFVLFIHVIILELAASIFMTLTESGANNTHDQLMSLIVGMSTLVALIKTQGVMSQLAYASIGPKAMRRLSTQFMNAVNHASNIKSAGEVA